MAKRSKFIRLHGLGEGVLISVRHKQIDVIIEMKRHRVVMVRSGKPVAGYEVYDSVSEIEALVDGRKRAKDKHPSRDVDPNPDTNS